MNAAVLQGAPKDTMRLKLFSQAGFSCEFPSQRWRPVPTAQGRCSEPQTFGKGKSQQGALLRPAQIPAPKQAAEKTPPSPPVGGKLCKGSRCKLGKEHVFFFFFFFFAR